MLARRFAIVCLLMMVFGMTLATLVAESDRRPAHGWSRGVATPFVFEPER